MSNQATKWDEVMRLLREAQGDLTKQASTCQTGPVPEGPLVGTLDEFEEFLDHNELELAWEALAAVAERTNASPVCWWKLAWAAGLMQLPEKESEARKRATPVISSDRALAIASLDAERTYRDLVGYQISIVLEGDGWHIDYEFRKPQLNGGGPHYVIDPHTGAILTKRYEQ